MVDVSPSNEKLRQRAMSIVMAATGCSCDDAITALHEVFSPEEEHARGGANRLFREPSEEMPVDLFTKPLSAEAHWRGMANLGLGRFRDGPFD